MKIELEISENNEGTDSPYWLILDPEQNMRATCDSLANQVTGPFFSREEAESHLKGRHYAFSKRAVVYCMSGYWSRQYKEAWRKADLEIERKKK